MFWDHLELAWEYEPQGFVIDGRPYLPDFLLPLTGTWIEVKGSEDALDHRLIGGAAEQLPVMGEADPLLLVLGPIPEPPVNGDWAWLGFSRDEDDCPGAFDGWWGFGSGLLAHASETSCAPPYTSDEDEWLKPGFDMRPHLCHAVNAYRAARSARFEHGESGGRS